MLPWETCILGSVNLAAHVRGIGSGSHTDWPGLRESVYQLVRFLDNTIDVSEYPLGRDCRPHEGDPSHRSWA